MQKLQAGHDDGNYENVESLFVKGDWWIEKWGHRISVKKLRKHNVQEMSRVISTKVWFEISTYVLTTVDQIWILSNLAHTFKLENPKLEIILKRTLSMYTPTKSLHTH